MSDTPASDKPSEDDQAEARLYPEDQARVDAFLSRGVNSVERKPFKPFRMMAMLLVVVTVLSVISIGLARMSGIY